MKRPAVLILAVVLFFAVSGAIPAYAESPSSPVVHADGTGGSGFQTVPGGMVYVVQRGDTLWGLARRFGTTVQAIRQANGLFGTRIYVNQRLVIPLAQPDPVPGGIVYVVQRGDTLWRIARRFGTTVRAVMAANNLRSTMIYVGQRLVIPGNDPVPTLATVAISPTSGLSGTLVRVVASGLPPYTQVSVGLGPQNSEFGPIAQGTTDGHGQFTVRVPVRGDEGIKWVFGAWAGNAHAASELFQITGSSSLVTISPTNGPSRTIVHVTASGFPPHTTLSIGVGPQNSGFAEAARGTTDVNGMLTVQVPAHGAPGMVLVFAAGVDGHRGVNASELFRITN